VRSLRPFIQRVGLVQRELAYNVLTSPHEYGYDNGPAPDASAPHFTLHPTEYLYSMRWFTREQVSIHRVIDKRADYDAIFRSAPRHRDELPPYHVFSPL
jgi:hypothetical protein